VTCSAHQPALHVSRSLRAEEQDETDTKNASSKKLALLNSLVETRETLSLSASNILSLLKQLQALAVVFGQIISTYRTNLKLLFHFLSTF